MTLSNVTFKTHSGWTLSINKAGSTNKVQTYTTQPTAVVVKPEPKSQRGYDAFLSVLGIFMFVSFFGLILWNWMRNVFKRKM